LKYIYNISQYICTSFDHDKLRKYINYTIMSPSAVSTQSETQYNLDNGKASAYSDCKQYLEVDFESEDEGVS